MNTIFKTILIIAIFTAVGVIIQQFIPSSLNDAINNAFVFFLTAMKPADFLLPINTVFVCIQLLGNFIFGVAGFYIIRWIIHLFSA